MKEFGVPKDYGDELRRIKEIAVGLRRLRPRVETDWSQPADWVVKDANIGGEAAKSLTITLTPTGCDWASSGGCTMCGEFEGSTKSETVPAMSHIAQFSCSVAKLVSEYRPEWIRIYQEGNYLNARELEESAQFVMIRLASLLGGVRRITIESMAKYINIDNARMLRKAVGGDVELEIGMGFEGEDDVVRNVCVNKGESIKDFQRALECLKEAGIRSLAYVLLKPPFLSESEGICEAKKTIQKAGELGFDAISLEPVSIHKYTLVHALNSAGYYDLPWLWSVIEVAKSATNIEDFRIGGVGFYPRPMCVAYNRHQDGSEGCNRKIWEAIREYGKLRQLDIFDRIECGCKSDWDAACKEEQKTPLKSRIQKQLGGLDLESYARALGQGGSAGNVAVMYTTAIAGGTQFSGGNDGG